MISLVVLQSSMDCVEDETGSCSGMCVMCAVDGIVEVSIKVEEDEIPEATSPSDKTEQEVRLQGVC
jgi:hypothetical protein